ncbi:unnamed protein product [Phyllotreta striolata]|uniref:Phosphoserine phosphatase n=1 Tax=Phyllotreta striolata TaxID=444603 RepID=A0A9N9TJF0_PHYSR|nr:unnamed protein product [Phyllotreta striolata]
MTSCVRETVQKSDCFCFDVDSTVIQEEGIDELARFLKKGEEISNLTGMAMSGNMTFRESLKRRLDILRPSQLDIKEFLKTKPPTLTPGIKKLVSLLQDRKIPVYLISGGFKCIIAPIAHQLNIPLENVFANRMKFYYSGEFAGFDENEPTSENGGKAVVIKQLKEKFGYKKVVLVGDGVTDLEACPPADAFIGYGGNVIRPKVKANSKWFLTDFNEIIEVLIS